MKRWKTTPTHQGWLLSLILVFALISGCQPGPTLTPGPTPEENPTATAGSRPTGIPSPSPSTPALPTPTRALDTAEAGVRGAQVQFWHPWGGETGAVVDDLVRQFNGSNSWGIWVQVERHASLDDLNTNLTAALDAKTPPDLAVAYPYRALEWEQSLSLVRLDIYVEDQTFGYSTEEQDDFYPVFWQQDILSGERFGIPAFRSGQFLYYNQSWARELGFSEPPENQAQFRQQVCAAARALGQDDIPANDGMGGYLLSLEYPAMLGWMNAAGAEISAPDGGYQFDTPAVTDSFNFLRTLYDEGCAWLADGHPVDDEFAQGHALFVDGSITNVASQTAMFQRTGTQDIEWTALPFPGTGGTDPSDSVIQVYGPDYVILPSNPSRQLAAWIFLKWMLEPENHALFVDASGSFPVRASSAGELTSQPAQWQAAVELLPLARTEPVQPSWGLVRWSVFDASTQLFRYYFTIDQVPALVKLLDETASGMYEGSNP